MLKAVIIDSSAVARGLLNTVLETGGYEVSGHAHTYAQGVALLIKHKPHFVCIAREQLEGGDEVIGELRKSWPKMLIFMVSGGIDAATLQSALASGVHGFIVKPFNADTVLKTIRNSVIAMVKRQQAAGAVAAAAPAAAESGDQPG